jgi:hypothetical protein
VAVMKILRRLLRQAEVVYVMTSIAGGQYTFGTWHIYSTMNYFCKHLSEEQCCFKLIVNEVRK